MGRSQQPWSACFPITRDFLVVTFHGGLLPPPSNICHHEDQILAHEHEGHIPDLTYDMVLAFTFPRLLVKNAHQKPRAVKCLCSDAEGPGEILIGYL